MAFQHHSKATVVSSVAKPLPEILLTSDKRALKPSLRVPAKSEQQQEKYLIQPYYKPVDFTESRNDVSLPGRLHEE